MRTTFLALTSALATFLITACSAGGKPAEHGEQISKQGATTGQVANIPPLPGKAYIMPPSKRADMLRQNSRDVPVASEGDYAPTTEDLRAIEALLPGKLAAQAKPGVPVLAGPGRITMDRQYVGLMIDGRPSVYGNFYPTPDYEPPLPSQFDPARDVVQVDDGGASFFGIVYDVGKGEITRIDFNGPY